MEMGSRTFIEKLLKFHKEYKKKATLTAVKPPSRFGALEINENNLIGKFKEKPLGENMDQWWFFCLRA